MRRSWEGRSSSGWRALLRAGAALGVLVALALALTQRFRDPRRPAQGRAGLLREIDEETSRAAESARSPATLVPPQAARAFRESMEGALREPTGAPARRHPAGAAGRGSIAAPAERALSDARAAVEPEAAVVVPEGAQLAVGRGLRKDSGARRVRSLFPGQGDRANPPGREP
jgi:hypothetical protein